MTAKTCARCSQPIPPGRVRCPCVVRLRHPKVKTHYCPVCRKTRQTPGECGDCKAMRAQMAAAQEGECESKHPELEERLQRLEERAARGEPLFAGRRGDGE